MQYFPIFLTANRINAMIVGGGDVAARKIELLLKSTKAISVMSKDLSPSVERLIKENQLVWLSHNYLPGHLDNINLVIAATDDEDVNTQVAQEADNLEILVNVVDQPELCGYITPAIIDRDPMLIAMSSSGKAPILLRMLREQIEKSLPEGYGKLANFCFKFRDHVKAKIKGVKNRRFFWESILRSDIGDQLLSGNPTIAEQRFINSLKQGMTENRGGITFIHTKHGDPDMLTLAAHRELQFADAVFYDKQVNERFVEYARRDADKYPQDIDSDITINYQHAIELAEQGQKVIYFLAGYMSLPHNSALTLSAVTSKELVCGE